MPEPIILASQRKRCYETVDKSRVLTLIFQSETFRVGFTEDLSTANVLPAYQIIDILIFSAAVVTYKSFKDV